MIEKVVIEYEKIGDIIACEFIRNKGKRTGKTLEVISKILNSIGVYYASNRKSEIVFTDNVGRELYRYEFYNPF